MTRSILAAAGLMGLSGLAAAPALAAELAIEVRGVRSDAGRIYVAVHTPREGEKFPYSDGTFAGTFQQAPTRATFVSCSATCRPGATR